MTLASTAPIVTYLENGSTVMFAVPFQFIASADLVVTRQDPTGIRTLAVLGADFTVTGGAGATGSVTMMAAKATGWQLEIKRFTARTQPLDLTPGDTFPAESIESAFSRGVAISQEIEAEIVDVNARALRVPAGETVADLPAAASRAGKLLGFDVSGVPILQTVAQWISVISLTITSASGQSVPTRGLLAGISGPVNGQRAYLSEAGREGWFQFSTANLSTNVTADPYQGLYVAPASATSGASGAWVREVRDATYALSWWNPTQLGNNGHTLLNSVAGLLASGSTLLWGPNIVTVAGPTSWFNAVHILGLGANISRVEVAAGTTAGTLGVQGMFRIRDSHSSVRRMGFKCIETGLFSGNPPCLLVQKGYATPATLAQRLIEDVEISECEFENTSLGIALGGSAETVNNNGVIVVPSKNVRIHHNIITTNQHGIEVFGSDNAQIHDNHIWPSPNAAAGQFSAAFRVLGSEEFDIHDNHIKGLGQDGASRSIYRMSSADFMTGARRANKNGRIRNNDSSNSWTIFFIDEMQGDNFISGNTHNDPISSTVQTVAYFFNAGGVADGMNQVVDRIFFTNNRFTGVANYVQHTGILAKHLEFAGDTIIGNSAGIVASGRLVSASFANTKYMLLDKVRFIMSDGGGTGFQFKNAAGCTLKVVSCVLPEQASGTGMLDGDGTGTFIKTLGNSGEDATFGSNSKHAAGTFALVT